MSTSDLPLFDRVDSNLSFLILEVTSQVESLRGYLLRPSSAAKRIAARDDYVDSLKRLVEEQCFRLLYESNDLTEPAANLLRAVITVASNLERLGDLCVNILTQATHCSDENLLRHPGLQEGLNEVLVALQLISHALSARNMPLAKKICETEAALDVRYRQAFDEVLASLETASNRRDAITFLNMAHYLERMGDVLLNVGEAVVFAAVGARLKLQDYVTMSDLVTNMDSASDPGVIQVERIWDSRSGMSIGRVVGDGSGEAPDLIVKEGNLDKLTRERDSISRWHALYPGLAPRVFGYRENEHMGALLMEFLHGHTLQALMIAGSDDLLGRAYGRLATTVPDLWRTTLQPVPMPSDYVSQIESRLSDVRRLHPSFFTEGKRIGSLPILSLDELIRRVAEVEKTLDAPFSVRIHGDFNANNIIYDDGKDRLHFIDLYRSGDGDFLQDASVFLVSCLRMPVFDKVARTRLNWVAQSFVGLVRQFAAEHGDVDAERRLALGLCRSLLTSTRFIPDPRFAEQLFVRAIYLMEALTRPAGAGMLRIPDEIITWKGALAA